MGMKINNSPPCKGCTERYSGCHAKCEGYSTWKQAWLDRKEALYGEQKRDRMLRDFYSDGCTKAIRKSGRKV